MQWNAVAGLSRADACLRIAAPLPPPHTAPRQGDLSRYAPDGEEQQAAVAAVADQDAYNWGYDPVGGGRGGCRGRGGRGDRRGEEWRQWGLGEEVGGMGRKGGRALVGGG